MFKKLWKDLETKMDENSLETKVPPKLGEVRWSKFFCGYIVLEHYESDCEWYFRFQNGVGKVFKAQACWSEMIHLERP